MPLELTWQDMVLRLALTVLACGAMGINRSMRGRTAGLRTTILVGLAASTAMILANLLLSVVGKTNASFATIDPMRLPLGILTGMGFLGGGVILKRGDLITGVTTAATLWLASVIGLVFGAGQYELGGAATLLGLATIWLMKWLEARLPREHRAILQLVSAGNFSDVVDFQNLAQSCGCRALLLKQKRDPKAGGANATLDFEIFWTGPEAHRFPTDLIELLETRAVLTSFEIMSEPE